MPRIMSYMIAHYGIDYMGYALRSIIDQVEQVHVFHTPHPSHGHQTNVACPETAKQIWDATAIGSDRVKRFEMTNIFYEGQQRNKALASCIDKGADMILVVDSDEVWHPTVLQKALAYAWKQDSARDWLINFTHFWRSFDYVCRDEGWPVRIIDLRHEDGVGYIPKEFGEIYHFGYAVRDEIMQYKWKIHGHKDELRPTWLQDKWAAWPPPLDCHPTNERHFWDPEPYDKAKLPGLLKRHPFYGLERID